MVTESAGRHISRSLVCVSSSDANCMQLAAELRYGSVAYLGHRVIWHGQCQLLERKADTLGAGSLKLRWFCVTVFNVSLFAFTILFVWILPFTTYFYYKCKSS